MARVSIVIIDFNGAAETRECLASLRKLNTKGLNVSIVVVDNGSKEPLHLAKNLLPAQTVIVRSDTNLGFTSGNNLGIEYAREHFQPDYILLLNNDTTVHPDFLVEMMKVAQDEQVGVVTPKIYFSPGREFHRTSYSADERGKVLWYAGGSIDWKNLDAFHRGVDEFDRGHFDDQTGTEFATGCAFLIPVRVLERVGKLNKKYFLYLEDVDWSLRIKKAGFKLAFCPKAMVWHKNAGSSGGAGSSLHQYYQTRNRLFFFMKYAELKPFAGSDRIQPTLQTLFEQWRYQFFIVRFALRLLTSGAHQERRGATDWFLGRMGKQQLL